MKSKYVIITIAIIAIASSSTAYWFVNSRNTVAPMITTAPPIAHKVETCERMNERASEDDISLPIICTADIGLGEDPVNISVLTGSTSDSNATLHVSRNGSDIFTMGGSDTDYAELSETYNKVSPTLRPGSFGLTDVTYDGYKDLWVLTSAGAYNFYNSYFAYNPKTKTFDSEPILDVVNESIDLKNKQVISFEKGRGFGDIYTEETYKFINGKYVLVGRFNQDIISFEDMSNGYVQTTEKLVNGKMLKTKVEKLSYEDVYGTSTNDEVAN